MDSIEKKLTEIIEKITVSKFSEQEKADILAQLTAGMHHLVWPMLLEHTPKAVLVDFKQKEAITINDYIYLLNATLREPSVARAIHDELKSALDEVYTLVEERL